MKPRFQRVPGLAPTHLVWLWFGLGAILLCASVARSEVIISEFLATNIRNLADEDGDFSDWIELQNTGDATVNLEGWFLTDNAKSLTEWRFPATNIVSGGNLVVFASSKDRRLPGKPLHTNFKLSADGEFLALVKPDSLTTTTKFSPAFPKQAPDISYGYAAITTNLNLISESSAVKVFIPTSSNGGNALGDTWKGGAEPFGDAAWSSGVGGVGYSDSDAVVVAQDSLVLRYSFDAAPVNNAIVDSKPFGNPNPGLNKGADWLASYGVSSAGGVSRSGVMRFVATNSDQIVISTNSSFDSTSGTIAFWIRSGRNGGPGAQAALLLERRAKAGGLWLLKSDDGTLQITANTTNALVRNSFSSIASVGDDNWHQVVLIYDQKAQGKIALFVDGVASGAGTNSGPWSWPSGQSINLGRSVDTTAGWRRFDGALDDLRIYNRALNEDEVAQLYSGDGGIASTELGVNLGTSMRHVNGSAFLRIPFQVPDASVLTALTLTLRRDDGYAIWLNGRLIARDNAPDALSWDSLALDTHASGLTETIVQSVNPGLLNNGRNILAIQGLNHTIDDPTFLISVRLDAFGVLEQSSVLGYLNQPTPGAFNGVGTNNLGPVILEVQQTPKIPNEDDDLLVTARVSAAFAPVVQVTLKYLVMFQPEVAVPMFDDGKHGDLLAGDGIYGATIPASASTNGQMVRYAVVAQDGESHSSRWPLFNDPLNSAQYLGTVIQPDYVTSALPVFQLFVSKENLSKVDSESGGRIAFYYNGEFYDNVYMELRGNTSAGLPKKSHRVEFQRDHPLHHPGPGGVVRKTSFIAEHLDPAYLRQGLSFWLLNESGTPAPFYYPVRLQMNGQFYQLASHTDVMGEDQLQRMGYDPRGALYKAAGNVVPGKSSTGGFEKKTRTFEGTADYDDLAAAISDSKSIAIRRTNVFEYFDVPNVVNYLACARWVQEADDVWANMTLYRDSEGDKLWRIIPFDMNLSWGALYYADAPDRNAGVVSMDDDNKSHPLYGGLAVQPVSGGSGFNRVYDIIISVPETRQMLLRRMRTLMDEWIQPPNTHPLLRKFEAHIAGLTNAMWNDAFIDRAKWKWPDLSGPYGLGPNQWLTNATQELIEKFIQPRRVHWYVTHSETNSARPIGVGNKLNAGIPISQPSEVAIGFGDLEFNPASGVQEQEYLTLTNPNPFAVDLSRWQLSGAVRFTFHGGTVVPSNGVLYVSPNIAQFRARTSGPRAGQGLYVVGPYQGQLSARGEEITLSDPTGRVVATKTFQGSPTLAQRYLRVSELMYHPAAAPTNSVYRTEDFEYIELINTGPAALDLAGIHFTNGLAFTFSGSAVTQLGAGQRVLVVHNRAAFLSRYPQAQNIAGEYLGSLSNGGERLTLHDAVGEVILDFQFDPQWHPITDGAGFSLVVRDFSVPYSAWADPGTWSVSASNSGSPGTEDPAAILIPPILVNEIMVNATVPSENGVELYNPTDASVDVSGWFLTDDFLTPQKYRLPANSKIAANGYLFVRQTAFNASPKAPGNFSLNPAGEEVYLFSADASGHLTGFTHGFEFGPMLPDVSAGRYVTSLGEEKLVAQAQFSSNKTNAGPRVGPVILGEIQFNPVPRDPGSLSYDRQFIEIRNLQQFAMALFDPVRPTNTWRLRGEVDFDFPTNSVIQALENVVVVGFDPIAAPDLKKAFEQEFSVPPGTHLFGPFKGNLGNGGGEVRLLQPFKVDSQVEAYFVVDSVKYGNTAPWPLDAAGKGASLQRILPAAYGDDPESWFAGVPSPGVTSGQSANPPKITSQPLSVTAIAQRQTATFQVSVNSSGPLGYQWLHNGEPIPGAHSPQLTVDPVLPEDEGDYQVMVLGNGGTTRSQGAHLTVLYWSFFVSQPSTRYVLAGTNVVLSAPAVGTGPTSYQWRRDGIEIPGETGPSLDLGKAQPEQSGVYDVVFKDDFGTLVSNPAILVVSIKPAFLFQPQPMTVLQGDTVVLFTTVSGTPPLSYRWNRSGKVFTNYVSSSNTGLLILPNIQPSNAGPYTVTVTNFGGATTTSPQVLLNVLPDADHDGIADAWEVAYGLNPSIAGDALLDADGDGVSNRDEYLAGTDPTKAASFLSLLVSWQSPGVVLQFAAASNHTYSIYSRTNVESALWAKVLDVPSRTTNRVVELRETNFIYNLQLYRVDSPAQP